MRLRNFFRVSLVGLISLSGIVMAETAATPAPAAAASHSSPWSMLWLPAVLILVFYFLMIRPQTKRAKEHRQLLENVSVGDEIVTTGGLMGKVVRLRDNFIVVDIARGTESVFQKSAVSSVLPKGTIDSV